MEDRRRILRCPECGLVIGVPTDEKLPPEGPTCAMGHPEVKMVIRNVTIKHG